MSRYTYYQDDDNPFLIVRHDSERATFERFVSGKGWIEDREWVGIWTGEYPYFSAISEEDALKIVRELEERGRE